MIAKTIEKENVRKLRKNGLSYNEIRKQVKVAKSSISSWCRDIKLSKEQNNHLKSKRPIKNFGAIANRNKRQKEIDLISQEAKKEIGEISLNEFKLIGTALYWGEGDKKNNTGVTNSDPEVIKFMMKWFREVCSVPEEKFKISIYYHLGQNEEEMKLYWSKITKVPLNQFHKSIFKKEGTGQRKNILYNGTCKVRICNEDLRHRILTWITQLYI